MTPQEAAEKAEKAQRKLEYPERPRRAYGSDGESGASFDARLDEYDNAVEEWLIRLREYRTLETQVIEVFKRDLLVSLDLTEHPKANRLYAMAWEHGHSSGYAEVAMYAEELAELLK